MIVPLNMDLQSQLVTHVSVYETSSFLRTVHYVRDYVDVKFGCVPEACHFNTIFILSTFDHSAPSFLMYKEQLSNKKTYLIGSMILSISVQPDIIQSNRFCYSLSINSSSLLTSKKRIGFRKHTITCPRLL